MDSEIKIFDVAPTDNDAWVVLIDGAPLSGFAERNQAVEIATALAQRHRPSRLLTRSESGEIEAITPFEVENTCARNVGAFVLSDDEFEFQ